jgi:hypothetical protein
VFGKLVALEDALTGLELIEKLRKGVMAGVGFDSTTLPTRMRNTRSPQSWGDQAKFSQPDN